MVVVFCPDCNADQEVIKDYCKIPHNCGEFAFICAVCGSLNVDEGARKIAI